MSRTQSKYTVNIVDTGIFWSIGKARGSNEDYESLAECVQQADQTLTVTQDIYCELGGDREENPPPSQSEYLDRGIREGWIEVADPLEDERRVNGVTSAAEDVITGLSNHPETAKAPEDAANIGLAVDYFDRNESMYVILHTTDIAQAIAANAIIPECGYYDYDINYVDPGDVTDEVFDPSHFRPR